MSGYAIDRAPGPNPGLEVDPLNTKGALILLSILGLPA